MMEKKTKSTFRFRPQASLNKSVDLIWHKVKLDAYLANVTTVIAKCNLI